MIAANDGHTNKRQLIDSFGFMATATVCDFLIESKHKRVLELHCENEAKSWQKIIHDIQGTRTADSYPAWARTSVDIKFNTCKKLVQYCFSACQSLGKIHAHFDARILKRYCASFKY